MHTVIIVIHVLISLGLIATVLLQSGRSAGLSGAIGGAGERFFGKRRGLDETLGRYTAWLAGAFLVTALLLSVLAGN